MREIQGSLPVALNSLSKRSDLKKHRELSPGEVAALPLAALAPDKASLGDKSNALMSDFAHDKRSAQGPRLDISRTGASKALGASENFGERAFRVTALRPFTWLFGTNKPV